MTNRYNSALYMHRLLYGSSAWIVIYAARHKIHYQNKDKNNNHYDNKGAVGVIMHIMH